LAEAFEQARAGDRDPAILARHPELPAHLDSIVYVEQTASGETVAWHSDAILRIVAQRMSDNLKQPIVLENLPGAAGVIGAERAARAPADGYTIFGANDGTLNMTPHLRKKVNYDTLESFEPVSLLANITWVLIANPSLPAKSVKDLIALAKANPGKMDYASGGVGSPQHIAMELFSSQAGVKLNHVPYKGAVPAITDLLAGRIQVFVGAINSLLPHIKDGKLRLLATAGPKRLGTFPDVPTIAETVPGVVMDVWLGVFMPAGTPRPIITKAQADIAKVLQERLEAGGALFRPVEGGQPGFQKYVVHLGWFEGHPPISSCQKQWRRNLGSF
jgi:tripartite-type tricarboxylate transporter receptor subunit TctC